MFLSSNIKQDAQKLKISKIRIRHKYYLFLVTNFGYEWEVAEAKNVRTKYKAGSAGEITADIAVYMGLRGINVTLKGNCILIDIHVVADHPHPIEHDSFRTLSKNYTVKGTFCRLINQRLCISKKSSGGHVTID